MNNFFFFFTVGIDNGQYLHLPPNFAIMWWSHIKICQKKSIFVRDFCMWYCIL